MGRLRAWQLSLHKSPKTFNSAWCWGKGEHMKYTWQSCGWSVFSLWNRSPASYDSDNRTDLARIANRCAMMNHRKIIFQGVQKACKTHHTWSSRCMYIKSWLKSFYPFFVLTQKVRLLKTLRPDSWPSFLGSWKDGVPTTSLVSQTSHYLHDWNSQELRETKTFWLRKEKIQLPIPKCFWGSRLCQVPFQKMVPGPEI